MGTLTFAELKDELRANMGNRDDLDSRLGRFLNLSQERLARMRNLTELNTILLTTIEEADNGIYLIEDGVRSIDSITILNGSESDKLTNILVRDFDRSVPDASWFSKRQPTHYIRYGSRLELFPLPDVDYSVRIRYSRWPTDLTLDGQKSDLDRKDDLLIQLATVIAATSTGNKELAAEYWNIFRYIWEEAFSEDVDHPDLDVNSLRRPLTSRFSNKYWADPFISSTGGI